MPSQFIRDCKRQKEMQRALDQVDHFNNVKEDRTLSVECNWKSSSKKYRGKKREDGIKRKEKLQIPIEKKSG